MRAKGSDWNVIFTSHSTGVELTSRNEIPMPFQDVLKYPTAWIMLRRKSTKQALGQQGSAGKAPSIV